MLRLLDRHRPSKLIVVGSIPTRSTKGKTMSVSKEQAVIELFINNKKVRPIGKGWNKDYYVYLEYGRLMGTLYEEELEPKYVEHFLGYEKFKVLN